MKANWSTRIALCWTFSGRAALSLYKQRLRCSATSLFLTRYRDSTVAHEIGALSTTDSTQPSSTTHQETPRHTFQNQPHPRLCVLPSCYRRIPAQALRNFEAHFQGVSRWIHSAHVDGHQTACRLVSMSPYLCLKLDWAASARFVSTRRGRSSNPVLLGLLHKRNR